MKSIIISIIMFLFLILIHEFGHFIVAKKSGIKVNEFAIGMGPKIFSKQKGETLYSINLLPIGGYCAMEGEDDTSDDERSFDKAPAYKRFLTILAGPLINLIFAAFIFTFVVFNTGIASNSIGGFTENSPAKESLEINDEIIGIAGIKVNEFSDISEILTTYYKTNSKDKEVSVRVKRDGDIIEKKINPKFENDMPLLGITPKPRDVSLIEAIGLGIKQVFQMIGMLFSILKNLFTGKLSFNALSGPVGVVKEMGRQVNLGLMNILFFLAYISVNLGFFNLLPIPALDGSKLFTSLYEMITKKKINKKLEERVTIVGFVLLLSLILIVTIKDIINLF
ncbi:site-2 protease family protein [Anaerococcus sp. AGMB00486]|uniref:Site-2 protease family protein n=1 Tax=Anaerococcus faecalis TaxID=2742993 RepID=A0ABX2N8U0_9FIRM|nr:MULTISPECIES: M50 family metallopeptidase [Anaerococcus]MDY3005931.1 M50 family metallopeptidase [Anaerococcus porci]NVF10947.1 site-2 protease family protein [Anaerococcus faecalis]